MARGIYNKPAFIVNGTNEILALHVYLLLPWPVSPAVWPEKRIASNSKTSLSYPVGVVKGN